MATGLSHQEEQSMNGPSAKSVQRLLRSLRSHEEALELEFL